MSISELLEGTPLIRALMMTGESAPSPRQKKQILEGLTDKVKDALVLSTVERMGQMRQGLEKASENQNELKELLEQLTAPPWHQATFLRSEGTSFGQRAVVRQGGGDPLVVTAGDGVDLSELATGDLVYLSHERNAIVGKGDCRAPRCGETSKFLRKLEEGGRLVLQSRDEEVIVEAASSLRNTTLRANDLIQWDSRTYMAYARIDRSSQDGLFLSEIPQETFEDVGGLAVQTNEIKHAVELHAKYPGVVDRYRKKPIKSCLLTGVPGVGKTLVARALSNWLKELRQSAISLFIAIKPGQLLSEWFGRSESNYRDVFATARRASEEHPGVPVTLFFDEVDSTGVARGTVRGMDVVSRVSNAFMSELDGLEERGNIFVVAATNRADTLDPALLRPGRLGDKIMEIPRPNMSAARDIFAKHLQADIPYVDGNGEKDPAAIREAIIDAAVSRIYSPNGNGKLATLKFRDMKRSRTVSPADMVSGAVIAQIATVAKDRACLREVSNGRLSGVCLADIVEAIDQEFRSAVRAITPENCHLHVRDLPRDTDVMDVEFPERRIDGPSIRYLNLHAA